MYLNVYDKNLNRIDVLDVFISLIWTKRYDTPGDFEITMSLDEEGLPDSVFPGNYVNLSEDNENGYFMIIETVEVNQDAENGIVLKITGSSLEVLLDNRIIWDKLTYTSKTSEFIIEDLITKSILSPSISDRRISNFIYRKPKEGTPTSSLSIDYDGDSLLDSIERLCSSDHNGISVRYVDGDFVYRTYTGEDRSRGQTKNDMVLYSPKMDSLASSRYLESIKNYKNVIQIVNENNKFVVGEATGIDRREIRESVDTITSQAAANSAANLFLYQHRKITALEGEAINDVYVFGRDVFIGDIVQFENGYGVEAKARITEYIYSEDISGINNYPTFVIIDEEGE